MTNENSWFRESADVPAVRQSIAAFSVSRRLNFTTLGPDRQKTSPRFPFFYLRPSRRVSIRRPVFPFSANPTNRSPPNFPKSRKIWPLLTSLFEVSAEAGRGIEKLEKLELKERARTILRKEKRKKKNVLSTNLIILKRSW